MIPYGHPSIIDHDEIVVIITNLIWKRVVTTYQEHKIDRLMPELTYLTNDQEHES